MPAPTTQFFTGRMLFLPPNQQRQSTEGNWKKTQCTKKLSLEQQNAQDHVSS